MKIKSACRDGREGIALVIVLGFLAVMTIMAVGMAISMRTERLASSSYLNMTKARLYCQSALADAMYFLEEIAYHPNLEPHNRHMPNFREYFLSTGLAEDELPVIMPRRGNWQDNLFTEYHTLPSIKTYVGDPNADIFRESLLQGIGTNFISYIPGRFWRSFIDTAEAGTDALQDNAQWLHVTDDSGRAVGRYMYVVINTSGRVDCNYIGREIAPSGMKIDGRALGSIPASASDYQSFLSDRDVNVRYESLRDLLDGNESIQGRMLDGVWSTAREAPVDTTAFTYFPPMRKIWVDDAGVNLGFIPIPLPGDEEGLAAIRDGALAAFRKVVDGEDWEDNDGADWKDALGAVTEVELFNLLGDFYSDGFAPWNPEGVSNKAVPMVNEVFLRTNIAFVEVWQPFVGDSNSRYEGGFEVEVQIGGVSSSTTVTNRAIPAAHEPFSPQMVQIVLTDDISDEVADLIVTIRGADGQVYDRVDFGRFSNPIELNRSWQVIDPRFNHLESQWVDVGSHSLTQINPIARQAFTDNASNPGDIGYVVDGDHLMYCANRPMLSTGELGYLPVAPWRTLKLYHDSRDPRDGKQNMDPVLDYFTLFPVDRPMYGLVNPNVKHDSHGSLLRPVLGITNWRDGDCWKLYDGDVSYDNLSPNNTANIYTDANIFHNMQFARNQFLNISDVGKRIFHRSRLNDFKSRSASDPNRYNELRFQHPMRRHSALCNTREQLYTVLLWGQALGEGEEEQWDTYPVLSEAQAVAIVWRDPYPDETTGMHTKFVRYMRWFE